MCDGAVTEQTSCLQDASLRGNVGPAGLHTEKVKDEDKKNNGDA